MTFGPTATGELSVNGSSAPQSGSTTRRLPRPTAETGASGGKNSGSITPSSATYVTDNGPLDLSGNVILNGTGVLVYFRGANGYLHVQGTPTLSLSAPTAAKSGSRTRSTATPAC